MPFMRAGINGSKPDAFDTIAVSTIEMAGATYSVVRSYKLCRMVTADKRSTYQLPKLK